MLSAAVLSHPAGAFASLVAAIVAALYAAQSRRFVPAFAAAAAAFVALYLFSHVPPDPLALAWLCLGVALLHAEFLRPTFGLAGVLGLGATAWGSWCLLAALAPIGRGAIALVGAVLLVVAVARTMRLRTLPP